MLPISDDETGIISDADSNASQPSVKRKMNPGTTSPKESSIKNQSGSNTVPGHQSGKEKKQKKDTTQQDDSAEVLKTINKHLQEKLTISSEKVKEDMKKRLVASELKCLCCSILKVKFKHEVNNLIFKYQMLSLQQNAQPDPPIQSPPSTF